MDVAALLLLLVAGVFLFWGLLAYLDDRQVEKTGKAVS